MPCLGRTCGDVPATWTEERRKHNGEPSTEALVGFLKRDRGKEFSPSLLSLTGNLR